MVTREVVIVDSEIIGIVVVMVDSDIVGIGIRIVTEKIGRGLVIVIDVLGWLEVEVDMGPKGIESDVGGIG